MFIRPAAGPSKCSGGVMVRWRIGRYSLASTSLEGAARPSDQTCNLCVTRRLTEDAVSGAAGTGSDARSVQAQGSSGLGLGLGRGRGCGRGWMGVAAVVAAAGRDELLAVLLGRGGTIGGGVWRDALQAICCYIQNLQALGHGGRCHGGTMYDDERVAGPGAWLRERMWIWARARRGRERAGGRADKATGSGRQAGRCGGRSWWTDGWADGGWACGCRCVGAGV